MIQVHLKTTEFEYDIHSLVKAFFPGKDVFLFSDEDEENRKKRVAQTLAEEASVPELTIEIAVGEKEVAFRMEGSNAPRENSDTLAENLTSPVSETYPLSNQKLDADQKTDAVRNTDTGKKSDAGKDIAAPQNPGDRKNALKRALYTFLAKATGRTLPWGTLTGIRPTKIPLSLLDAGKTEEEIRNHMQETYLCSAEKTDLSISIAKREQALLSQLDCTAGYSLYIGIPFCPSTCLYCSFTSYPIASHKTRVDAYLDALEKELDDTAVRFAKKKLQTIYIGGGTPTTLTPLQLDRLIRKIKCSFDLSYLKEFTVEAGRPDSITREKLEVLKFHGVKRISINPQTMKQETLDLIGRRHTVEQTIEGFTLARELGFDNINMDLILGLPNETVSDVRHTMEVLKDLKPDNVTVDSLALKRAARLQMFKEDYKDLSIVNTAEQIDLTAQYCKEMGLFPYYLYRQKNMAGNFENVGYASEGKAGLYNILMMEEVQSIVACGAGTVTKRVWDTPDDDGRTLIERCDNVKDVTQYIARIDEMIGRKRRLFSPKK